MSDRSANNIRLRQLVKATGLGHAAALAVFNRGLGPRGYKLDNWKGYFCNPTSRRFYPFSDDMLEHAERVFGDVLRKAGLAVPAADEARSVLGDGSPKSPGAGHEPAPEQVIRERPGS